MIIQDKLFGSWQSDSVYNYWVDSVMQDCSKNVYSFSVDTVTKENEQKIGHLQNNCIKIKYNNSNYTNLKPHIMSNDDPPKIINQKIKSNVIRNNDQSEINLKENHYKTYDKHFPPKTKIKTNTNPKPNNYFQTNKKELSNKHVKKK